MRSSMATRSTIVLITAIILTGLIAPMANAAVTIEVGDYRELAQEFVKEKFDLSDDAARTVMRQYEVMHGNRIIDNIELPDGAVLDFVTVDGQADDADSMVTFEGSGILRQARPQLFGAALSDALNNSTPAEQRHLMSNIQSAVRRGWFVQTITSEQREQLMTNHRLPGEGQMQTQQARIVRILVVLNNFPHWDDVSPSPSRYDGPADALQDVRSHPLHEQPLTANYFTPGGPIDPDTGDSTGLASPAWNATGVDPQGSGGSTANHPRIEYIVDGREGTSVDLREQWYEFLFNQSNTNSISNYYWENSNGNLRIQGNRSDIRGPLESHHILDRVPYATGAHNYAVQPGTPIIERVPAPADPPYGPEFPNLRGISADSSNDIIGTLGYDGPVYIRRVEVYDPDADPPGWDTEDPLDIETEPDRYDSRRVIFKTDAFDHDDFLRVRIGGNWLTLSPDRGWSLTRHGGQSRTTWSANEVLDSSAGNRLRSLCYYTHDHIVENGEMGSHPYQLAHLRSGYSSDIIDDICGTRDDGRDHRDRLGAYQHDHLDHRTPNMAYFESPDSKGAHNYGVWLSDLGRVMVEEGVDPSGYNSVIHLYPSDIAGGPDEGGTSGPWSGAHVPIPNSAVVLPDDAGLVVTAHELGHALMGWPDLYDLHFYVNNRLALPPDTAYDVTNMIGPYSVMARAGGVRVDAFLKSLSGWATPVAVTEDILDADLPAVEGTLQDPVIYKLPGRPHYIKTGVPPSEWKEYFLVENRNRNGGDYFGDPSPLGMYIYHIDLRFGQYWEDHPAVIVEQADGLYELESQPEGQVGDLDGDPFPGSHDVRNWTQYTNPSSKSHGFKAGTSEVNQVRPATVEPPEPPAGYLANGTETDSFSRVTNISDAGSLMTADLHVVPREIIVTQVPIPGQPDEVPQGTEDFLVQHLLLDNDGNPPNFSMGDVELATIRIDESGSSQRDSDIDRVSLFDDTNNNQQFDVDVDTRIATATFQNQSAFFTNLNYRIPLNERRHLFITYDISAGASSDEGNSIGASFKEHDYIRPEVPGAVQERMRTDMTASSAGLGAYRFPINSNLADIIEDPDTVTITPISRAPVDPAAVNAMAFEPGDTDVPILSLDCDVDQDSVAFTRVIVDQTGTVDAVADVTAAKLFVDENQDGVVDGGDTLVEETNFAMVAGVQRASFDFASTPIPVVEGGTTSLLLTASFSEDLPLEEPPLTFQYTLEDTTYITLEQAVDIVSDENFPMSSDLVSTPIPNNPPAAPENLAATVLGDGSVLLTWDLSDDDPNKAGENDVEHYNIYRAQDPADFVDVTPSDAYATVAAGATEYNDVNAPLGVPVYYMMRAWDGVQEGPNSNVAGPVTASDQVDPTFSNFDPEQGADGVPLDTDIAFTVSDNASGVDQATLLFEVNGTDVSDAPETTITGSAAQYQVVYDPPEDFDFLDKVQVRLQASDNAGNESALVSYEFTITGPPVHFVAGVVTDPAGNPEQGVRVEAGGLSDITNADGEYQIQGLSAGDYTVVPSKDGRSFEPEQQTVTVPPDAVAIDFTARPGFDITGTVVMENGDPLAGVSVTDGMHMDVTTNNGQWAFEDVPAGTYTIIPNLTGWVFDPPELEVTVNATNGNSTDNQFVAAVETFDVTGTIRTLAGNRFAGVDVEARQGGAAVATGTTNANGVYAVSGLEPGTYTIQPVDEDFAFDPENREVEVATDIGNIDFVAAAIYEMTLSAGLQMVGVPVTPMRPDADAVFGGIPVARWDPQTAGYVTAPSTNPLLQVEPGAGFWTNAGQQTDLEVPGTVFGNNENLNVTVRNTWNILGNPYDRDLPWEQMSLPQGGPASTYGFIYDANAGTYRLVSTAPGLGAVTTVPKNAGFWLRTAATTQVGITGPGTAPASAEIAQQVQRTPADDAWIIPVVARAAGALDACSYAGVLPQAADDPDAYQMHNPPAVGPYVDLYFLDNAGNRLAVDVRDNRPVQTWQFEVATDMADVQVEVQMPDLSEVPNDKSVYLVDETAGKRMYARTLTTYSYPSGEGGARRFTLEVADRSEAGLMITSASAQAADGGITVSYTLSANAQVQVEVLNIAGRKVATLASGETAPAGLSTCGWNGRGSTGTAAPAGRYLVRVSARADDGQKVQALVPVQLER